MKLTHLDLEYFRCFKQYHIDFASGITILIGKNGAGKSTLIDAIHKALSFVFKKEPQAKNDRTLSSGIPSLKVESFDKEKDLVRNEETGLAFPHISIKAKADFSGTALDWEMYAPTSTFKMQPSKYSEAFATFMDIVEEKKELPILAFYSDSFPHVESRKTNGNGNRAIDNLRNFGFYQWNEETACSSIWIDKLKKAWKEWDRHDRKIKDLESNIRFYTALVKNGNISQNEANENISKLQIRKSAEIEKREKVAPEINAIKECLVQFTQDDPVIEVQNIFLDIYDEELCIEDKSGNNPLFKQLPAGYKRLLYMVLDIAYRSYILNGTTQSPGIVIIDEIDLHLHPSLEQTVLQRLRDTFPNIQFIVSTHSALVIANLNASISNGVQTNKVYMLHPGEAKPLLLPNLYGVDYNAAMRDFMGTPPRNENIKQLIDEYLSFKSMGLETEAVSTYSKIESLVDKDEAQTVLKEIEERLKELQ